jgi:hypothetical protein
MKWAVVIISLALNGWLTRGEAQEARYTPDQIKQFIASARTIEAAQPPADLIRKIEQSVSENDPGTQRLSQISSNDLPDRQSDVIMWDNIPYFRYYSQKDSSRYILHPMRTGRFFVGNASGALVGAVKDAVLGLSYELPNGGLAWYYPRHYKVARMLGEQLKYSAISQGTLLAGFAAVAKEQPKLASDAAERTLLALDWPFEKGGVNLNNMAVLEMPSFAGPPEIILNGWIDALLHMRDYGVLAKNERALETFRNNINFLAEILPNFDAPDANISRYSDLSPYRAKVTLERPEDAGSLRILYVPKVKSLNAIIVPLQRTKDPENFSIYENQIFRQNGRNATVWLSCSQLYDTVVLANTASLQVNIPRGLMDRLASAPGVAGEPITMTSYPLIDGTSYSVVEADRGLICGYPTNFAKYSSENFYHSYHVVSLLLLAMGLHVTDDQRLVMIRWALHWLDDMDRVSKAEGLKFRNLQLMLESINDGKIEVSFTDFSELLEAAQQELMLDAGRH